MTAGIPGPRTRSIRPAGGPFCHPGIPGHHFRRPYAHGGSRKNLLGDNPDPKLVQEFSNELQVTPQTPPTFLFTPSDDTVVPPENSVNFYLALHKAGVPVEMHVREGPSRSWSRAGRSNLERMASLAGELAP
jgi:acetyl esterase/lipase